MDFPLDNYDGLPQKARDLLLQQQQQIAALTQRLEREEFAQELREFLMHTETISTILAPFSHEHLLEMVIRTAAEVIHAQSGTLFLLDEEANDLIFQVAFGPAARDVKQFRVPVGHGIVGMVVLTGQGMAVADAQQNTNVAHDIARAINYIPQSILCVPMFYDDHIIGALELLNKAGKSEFSVDDMETLGQFASIAAFAIAQSQAYDERNAVLGKLLAAFRASTWPRKQTVLERAAVFAEWFQHENTASIKARKLAHLVSEILQADEQEIDLCTGLLQSVVTSIHNRNLFQASGLR